MTQSKVLIVDDDRLTLTIVADTLREAGLVVETAQNGQEALHKLADSTLT